MTSERVAFEIYGFTAYYKPRSRSRVAWPLQQTSKDILFQILVGFHWLLSSAPLSRKRTWNTNSPLPKDTEAQTVLNGRRASF